MGDSERGGVFTLETLGGVLSLSCPATGLVWRASDPRHTLVPDGVARLGLVGEVKLYYFNIPSSDSWRLEPGLGNGTGRGEEVGQVQGALVHNAGGGRP